MQCCKASLSYHSLLIKVEALGEDLDDILR